MPDAAAGHDRHAVWLAETVRLSEARWGLYDDADDVRRLRHAGLTPAEAIQARQLALARREGLDHHAARWRDTAVLLALAAGIVAVLVGCGAALGALGDGSRPVNLFWALGGLLGMHTLALAGWLASLLWGRHLGSLVSRLVLSLAGRMARLPGLAAAGNHASVRPSAAALLPSALLGLWSRAGITRWLAGGIGHLWWLLALVSALVTLLALLSTRRYGFVWETTLLQPDTFVSLTQALGRLPAALGFSVPDAAAVRASGGGAPLDAPVQVLWANWLLGCLVVYGVVPRLLAAAGCLGIVAWRRRRVRLDTEAPAYAALRERLTPSGASLGVADPAPATLAHTGGAATAFAAPAPEGALAPDYAARADTLGAHVLVGVELALDGVWPPMPLAAVVIDAGRLDGRDARNALLEQFARHRPARVGIVCDASQTPDRGTIGLITEIAHAATQVRICLLADGGHDRTPQWRERLSAAGLDSAHVSSDVAGVLAWLGEDDAREPS